MSNVINMFIDRPYVAAFLVVYIVAASQALGWRWALLHILSGFTIAHLSEWSSISNGFPYGWYHYVYDNLKNDWLVNGVPVWDSLSYVFMCFAGLYVALRFPLPRISSKMPSQLQALLVSAAFTTILDIVIDPVAHVGDQWFLGKIYYYPEPGWYFDITMANFAGWFLVSFAINAVGLYVLSRPPRFQSSKLSDLFGLGLYFGIMGFGLSIALMLGMWTLVAADLFWIAFVAVVMRVSHKTAV